MVLSIMKMNFIVVFIGFILIISFINGCIVNREIMVEMRDGIHLATDIYLSKINNNPHGAILIRTPYNKDDRII